MLSCVSSHCHLPFGGVLGIFFVPVVRGPVLGLDEVRGTADYSFSRHLLSAGTPWGVCSAKTTLSPGSRVASRMVAFSFDFSRFLKKSVFSQAYVDPNTFQTSATQSEISKEFRNLWA